MKSIVMSNSFSSVSEDELRDINGGIAPVIVVALLIVPVISAVVTPIAEAVVDLYKADMQKAYQDSYERGYRRADDEFYIQGK